MAERSELPAPADEAGSVPDAGIGTVGRALRLACQAAAIGGTFVFIVLVAMSMSAVTVIDRFWPSRLISE